MRVWVGREGGAMGREVRGREDGAVDGRARWGLGLLAFQAVGREGLETVVFTLAIIFSTSTAGALSGAVIGLAGGLGISFVIYPLGPKRNPARFFTVTRLCPVVLARRPPAASGTNPPRPP